MKMTDMKTEAMKHEQAALPCQPEYPYGLRIHLDECGIKKLGIELPEVGKELSLEASVRVISAGHHESLDGVNRSLELQIETMGLKA